MKILKVIHGYPMRYNAGSEVYSQMLCQGLADRHEVQVFTREEDAFAPDYRLRKEKDPDDPRITLQLVNNPRLKDRYRAEGLDARFAQVLEEFHPDLIHVGHLNHLSTSLLREGAQRQIPIVFTLHDYWLMCPRGQFMQMFPEDANELWAACDSQEDRKCALRCYSRYFSGAPEEEAQDVEYWTRWVSRRMQHVREMTELVDLFIAPARYLLERFRDEFHLPEAKLTYLDYGFDHARLRNRKRVAGEPFTFGYIGTHIPAKGIHDLLRAFGRVTGDARLRIWGRPRGQDTEALRELAASLPDQVASRVEWLPEYKNESIVPEVFDRCDAIVVPSVWVENSPLVIHEAQQVRVPVITANAGGMAEYVHHEVNGLLFPHRSVEGLSRQMQRLVDDPALAARLGARGYLYDERGLVPERDQHLRDLEAIYERVLERRRTTAVRSLPGPWRITFDTNPDTCNLHCVMCEEHAETAHKKDGGKTLLRVMPFELLERVVEEAVPNGLRELIPSTMGEPLLYDHFDQLIQLCERHGLRLNLTTNGTFPRLGAAEWARRIVPVASDVKISWNGATRATQEAIMRGSRWETALENLRTFISVRDAHAAAGGNRCRVTMQLTFLESNVGELGELVYLAAELGVDRVKGHHVWVHRAELVKESLRRDPEAIRRWNQAVQEARAVAEAHLRASGKTLLLENFFPLDETATGDLAPGGHCPFLGQEAWVSAEGRFDPCCAPDALRRTLGDFGNLQQRSLMEIWNGLTYQELLKTYCNRELCLRCNMRKQAGGET